MRRENCPICCGDSFECGGGVSGVCIGSDGGPYCCLTDKDGSACGEAHPCRIHRPQPAPSAEADPSKERIAAALALAEAVCALATAVDGDGSVPPALLQARQDALRAYRATAPKLRTRAEVDAEIVSCIRDDWFANAGNYPDGLADSTRANLLNLCREETAPAAAGNNEETRGVPAKIGGPLPRCSSCGSEPGPSVELTFQWRGNREWYCTRGGCCEPSALTGHDADTRELQDPEPCGGCEALSKAIDQAIRDMLSGGHPFEKGVAKAINDLRAAQKGRS